MRDLIRKRRRHGGDALEAEFTYVHCVVSILSALYISLVLNVCCFVVSSLHSTIGLCLCVGL